jgi:hypothetical protein
MKMKSAFDIITGLGIGATLVQFFDPNGGNRRRALIRDKQVSIANLVQAAIADGVTNVRNRSRGLLHDAKAEFETGRVDVRPDVGAWPQKQEA